MLLDNIVMECEQKIRKKKIDLDFDKFKSVCRGLNDNEVKQMTKIICYTKDKYIIDDYAELLDIYSGRKDEISVDIKKAVEKTAYMTKNADLVKALIELFVFYKHNKDVSKELARRIWLVNYYNKNKKITKDIVKSVLGWFNDYKGNEDVALKATEHIASVFWDDSDMIKQYLRFIHAIKYVTAYDDRDILNRVEFIKKGVSKHTFGCGKRMMNLLTYLLDNYEDEKKLIGDLGFTMGLAVDKYNVSYEQADDFIGILERYKDNFNLFFAICDGLGSVMSNTGDYCVKLVDKFKSYEFTNLVDEFDEDVVLKMIEKVSMHALGYTYMDFAIELFDIYNSDEFKKLINSYDKDLRTLLTAKISSCWYKKEYAEKLIRFYDSDKIRDFIDEFEGKTRMAAMYTIGLMPICYKLEKNEFLSDSDKKVFDKTDDIMDLFRYFKNGEETIYGLHSVMIACSNWLSHEYMSCVIDLLNNNKEKEFVFKGLCNGLEEIISYRRDRSREFIPTLVEVFNSDKFNEFIVKFGEEQAEKIIISFNRTSYYTDGNDFCEEGSERIEKMIEIYEDLVSGGFEASVYEELGEYLISKKSKNVERLGKIIKDNKDLFYGLGSEVAVPYMIIMNVIDDEHHSVLKGLSSFDKLNLVRAYKICKENINKEESDDFYKKNYLGTFYETLKKALETNPEILPKWSKRIVDEYPEMIKNGVLMEVYDVVG